MRGEEEVIEETARYLASAKGQALVLRRLQERSLRQHLADDVRQETLTRVLLKARSDEPILNVEAFANDVIAKVVTDVARGRRRRREVPLTKRAPDQPDGEELLWEADPVDAAEQPVIRLHVLAQLGDEVDAIRNRLAAALRKDPERAAGGLVVLAIAHGDAAPAEDCPTPDKGVDPHERVLWAGVFYAGPPRSFPLADDSEDDAMRKRRSRAIQRIRATLAAAAGDDLRAMLEGTDD